MSDLFDLAFDGEEELRRSKEEPFHMVAEKGEEEILKWLKESSESLQKRNSSLFRRQRSNLAAYRGIQYKQPSGRSNIRATERIPTNKTERFVVNHLYDLTETRIAQLTRIKPSVQILPKNNEWNDKNAAKATKILIDHLWSLLNFDDMLQNIHRHRKIFGEAFLFITWNKDIGDEHPMAGQTIEDDETGEQMEIKEELRIGDVDYDLEVPWRVLIQHKECMKEAEYCYRVSIKHTEDLKKMYTDKKDKIKADSSSYAFDLSSFETQPLEKECVVFEFFHKKTSLLPKGKYIKFTKDVILEESDHPYSHGEFPFIHITDLDIPHLMRGVSQYEMIKPIQNMHNNLSTLLAKNIYLMGHAKWVMPKGACKLESLGNDNTVVQYQGPVAPQMLQVAPNPAEAYAFRDKLKEEMEQIYSVHGVSRGQPPQGITAGVALQFLNEQEAERSSAEIAKHNDFVRKVAKLTLSVAGDYYENEDNRLVRILGKDNEFLVESFDTAHLSKEYDIKVEISNALADSKAGKTQRIIELLQYKPDALTPERALELLDLGDYDKAIDLATTAVRAAESEVEDILSGKQVADPEPWEDYIVHWRVKVKAMQRRAFKELVPLEYREALKENVMMLEFLMWEKAAENPLFQSKLAQLDLFPLFYRPGQPAPMSKEQQEAVVQGQANRGEPITGQIPGTEAPPLSNEPNKEPMNE